MCVDTVSLGNVARSTTRTRWPWRASSIAVGEPAHRAPTTTASYLLSLMSCLRSQRSEVPCPAIVIRYTTVSVPDTGRLRS